MSAVNSTSVVKEAAEGLGLLFYLINPTTTSFSEIELCPDYVGQVRYEDDCATS